MGDLSVSGQVGDSDIPHNLVIDHGDSKSPGSRQLWPLEVMHSP